MNVNADLILVNAKALTMDHLNPVAEAVAISRDRVLAVGSYSEISTHRTGRTEIIDCQGFPLIPGINDAHCHVLATATSLSGLDCGGECISSLDDLLAEVSSQFNQIPPGRWIRGYGLEPGSLKESRYPTRWELDSVAPHNPVRLDHASGHATVLNTMALAAAGIKDDTPDPVEGVIDRDLANGQPTGLLLEMAGYLRERLGNTRSAQDLESSVSQLSKRLLSYGITSVQDAGPNNGIGTWETFQSLVSSGAMRQRMTMMAGAGKLEEFLEAGLGWSCGNESLRLGHAKIMLTLTTGDLHPAIEDLEKLTSNALALGFPYAVHAVEQEALAALLGLHPVHRLPDASPGRATPLQPCVTGSWQPHRTLR